MPPITSRIKAGAKEDVSIQTVTVDVKVIRVDKKQMTLAVFRQLDEEPVITKDGKLAGEIWGRVNWKRPKSWEDYYIVWQQGNELRKCPMVILEKIEGLEYFSFSPSKSMGKLEAFHRYCFGRLPKFETKLRGCTIHKQLSQEHYELLATIRGFKTLDLLFIAV